MVYDKYVDIYNSQGHQAAQDFVNNKCGMDYASFQRKMHKETSYSFNRSTRKFEEQGEEAQFMSLEDLCSPQNSLPKGQPFAPTCSSIGFDNLIVELMRDRLTEMHKFISFNQSSKQIIVNSRAIKDSGYVLSIL